MASLSNCIFSYSIQQVDGINVLYHGKKKVIYYEQLFDLINRAHTEGTGHGARDAMLDELAEFQGIGRFIINQLTLFNRVMLQKSSRAVFKIVQTL